MKEQLKVLTVSVNDVNIINEMDATLLNGDVFLKFKIMEEHLLNKV